MREFFKFPLTAREADWMVPGFRSVSVAMRGKVFFVNSIFKDAVSCFCYVIVWNPTPPHTFNEQFYFWVSGPSPPPGP